MYELRFGFLSFQLDNVFPFRHVFLATSKKMDLIERDIEVNWSQKAVASICYNGPVSSNFSSAHDTENLETGKPELCIWCDIA